MMTMLTGMDATLTLEPDGTIRTTVRQKDGPSKITAGSWARRDGEIVLSDEGKEVLRPHASGAHAHMHRPVEPIPAGALRRETVTRDFRSNEGFLPTESFEMLRRSRLFIAGDGHARVTS